MKMLKAEILPWAYMLNAVAFILHEMDAVFWKEWELFGIASEYLGLIVFILAHVPLFLVVFYGMMNLGKKSGLAISLVMGVFGMVHFVLHAAIGRDYFVTPFSSGLVNAVFVISAVQLYFTVRRIKESRNPAV